MARHTISILMPITFAFALGCKGETVVKENPDTLKDLDVCKKTLAEKEKLAQALTDENARLMRGSAIVMLRSRPKAAQV